MKNRRIKIRNADVIVNKLDDNETTRRNIETLKIFLCKVEDIRPEILEDGTSKPSFHHELNKNKIKAKHMSSANTLHKTIEVVRTNIFVSFTENINFSTSATKNKSYINTVVKIINIQVNKQIFRMDLT